ncbi:MAG: multidrug efflux system outer membrane protein [Desulforhopalus sp.]|jgi:multidrug efflux system outer membrane protein
MNKLVRVLPGICLLLFFLSACATKLQEAPKQEMIVEDTLPETTTIAAGWATPAGDKGEVDDGWLANFNDPQLVILVTEALDTQNPRMRLMSSFVDRAEAMARLGGAALQPTVVLGGGLSETSVNSSTSASLGVAVSWEADVWGRVKAGANATAEQYRAALEDFEFARQSLAANVARSWYLATELSMQEKLAEEVVSILTEQLRLTKVMEKVGQVTREDVYLVSADLSAAENSLRQAIGGQRNARRSLEILLGRYPSSEIESRETLVPIPPPIPVGLPSSLLERRPDLRAAERQVASAFFLSEEARLAKLPSFSLTAGVGGANSIDGLIGSIGAGVFAPLFDGGALEANLDAANSDQEAAIANYGLAVLDALQEVEGALTNEALLAEREMFLSSAMNDNSAAYRLATKRYDMGEIEALTLLQMQTRWIGSRISHVNIQNQQLVQRINLHLTLGGSFEEQ